jgi:ubiquinone/menaquinone biosynthesis C-methylase UbiE
MTDVFTHAVVVNSLAGHWRNDMSILDVGTGHGYLPFLIANILRNKGLKNYNIKGIDIYP